jgi:sugar phosphate isomerase/epimerase
MHEWLGDICANTWVTDMSTASKPEIYFSFFMFTVDLQPENHEYTEVLIRHLQAIADMGYDGFDMHIAPRAASVKHFDEVESYRRLKDAFDRAGFYNKKFATNVGTTSYFDPTSPYREQRQHALAYLKSRVDITAVLGGDSNSIMSGPFIYPYGAFPVTDLGEPLWSDALLDWMEARYRAALPILEEVAEYAVKKRVILAIEPVKNWETPPPNMVWDVLNFVEGIKKAPCGITIDTAQSLMESQGPSVFLEDIARAYNPDPQKNRLNYIHISAPDRGAVHDSWIPWDFMLGAIKPVFNGPYLIEVFNAIPPLDSGMRMTRRRFWRPGEDPEGPEWLSAYHIAEAALKELREQLERVRPHA